MKPLSPHFAVNFNCCVAEGITIIDAPELQNPVINTDALIKCKVAGNPAPKVTWLRGNEYIEAGMHVECFKKRFPLLGQSQLCLNC